MTHFSLTTTWLNEAPIEAVYEAIYRSEGWPPWWPAAEDWRGIWRDAFWE